MDDQHQNAGNTGAARKDGPPDSAAGHAQKLETIRHEILSVLRRGKSARTTAWTRERPTDWRPTQCVDPRTGEYFTEAGAWEYIEELLIGGHPLEQIELEMPPGRIGYVLLVKRTPRDIYIKLQLGSGKIHGRSFHDSVQVSS